MASIEEILSKAVNSMANFGCEMAINDNDATIAMDGESVIVDLTLGTVIGDSPFADSIRRHIADDGNQEPEPPAKKPRVRLVPKEETKAEKMVEAAESEADPAIVVKEAMASEVHQEEANQASFAPTFEASQEAPKKRKARAMVPVGDSARNVQIENLTIEDIIEDFPTTPPLTAQEAKKFVLTCRAKGLNPYLGEVYIVKYKSENGPAKASIIVGKDAFMRKADEHPQFTGMEAGVVIQVPGSRELIEREGTLVLDDEKLIGGWARIHREDRQAPIKSVVALREYDTGRKLWSTKKATMIRKCAVVSGLREAFASDFSGLYDESEMAQVIDPAKEVA